MWIVLGLFLLVFTIGCLAFWALSDLCNNLEDGY